MEPIWGIYNDADQAGSINNIHGVEYENSNFIFNSKPVQDHDPPCAVCRVTSRSTQIMIPGRNQCYAGWNLEYNGYLMSEHHSHKGRKEFICVDSDPETDDAGFRSDNGALLYAVEGVCGSLPCPPYIPHRELTCAVCSK